MKAEEEVSRRVIHAGLCTHARRAQAFTAHTQIPARYTADDLQVPADCTHTCLNVYEISEIISVETTQIKIMTEILFVIQLESVIAGVTKRVRLPGLVLVSARPFIYEQIACLVFLPRLVVRVHRWH